MTDRRTRTTQPTEDAAARRVADDVARAVHTLRAGRILSYRVDGGSGPTADVQLVHREIVHLSGGRTEARALPPLRDVPVIWPAGGGRGLVWGLVPGDPVYVQVREVSHDSWDAGQRSEDQTPQSDRRHDWSDAVVLPMDTIVGRMDGAPVIVLGTGDALHLGATGANEAVPVASALREELDAIWSALKTHVHPFVGLAAGTAGNTAPSGTARNARDIASRRVVTDDTVVPGVGVTG